MPWLVIYIGLLFPITLLLVVLAMDWYDNSLNDRRRRAFHIQEQYPGTVAQDEARFECPQPAHRQGSWWKAS